VPLREAILQANHVRLRPILMTTLSIVAGLVPTAVGIGAGSAQRSAVRRHDHRRPEPVVCC
jgi:HAE1 family hydrophobic/amphiphilic exporter-1